MTADDALVAACGMKANALAMSDLCWRRLKTSPAFRSRVMYTDAHGVVTKEAVMAFRHRVPLHRLGDLPVDAARGTSNIVNFWTDNALFFVYNPSPGLRDMGFGASFMRNKVVTRTFEDQRTAGVDGIMKY